MLKRLDSIEVATSDLADAASLYEKNFGFRVTKSVDGKSASVEVGGAKIRLASGDKAAAAIAASGEGMIALWLEADDLDLVVAGLHRAGLSRGAGRLGSGRRTLGNDPKLAEPGAALVFARNAI